MSDPERQSTLTPTDAPHYAVHQDEASWKRQLDPVQFAVTRQGATERAFTGRFWDHFENGTYHCVCCRAPLFRSETKFDAGCGWPSYFEPVDGEVIERLVDHTHGMTRIEVRCQRCGAHLGHVFDDGPAPTGERYCINSASLHFAADPADDRA
jgi:peptide-methionine (R)-S-oxide reductase